MDKFYYLKDPRFKGIEPSLKKIWLSTPTMHGDEEKWVIDAIRKNWVSTVGENINAVEQHMAAFIGRRYAVGLSSGTAALHLAVKLMGEKLYGTPKMGHGTLENKKVFCSDMTFGATVNPVVYEGGEPVFIDTEYDTWNMDPVALERAFEIYPYVKLIVVAHLYGTPGKLEAIRAIADRHGALIIEDAAESLSATYNGVQTGCFGDVAIVSMNGNKLITGSSGGFFLTDDVTEANKVRKWSTQSRENAPWYQHEELGYNYRMSNIVAGVIRGQIPYIEEHRKQKKVVYNRYKDGLKDLPVKLNPVKVDGSEIVPNYWLSCLLIDREAMCPQVCGEQRAMYIHEAGKSCPTEVLEVLAAFNAEGRPVWKPMHMQPIYRMNSFVVRDGNGRAQSDAYIACRQVGADGMPTDIGSDIFERGLCLPSDNKMTEEQQDRVIEIIRRCFK